MSGRGLPFELRMALRYLWATRREGPVAVVTLLCAGGIFTGTVALVLTLALLGGLHGDIRDRLLSANPHVVVRRAQGEMTQDDARHAIETALRVEGVVAAAPYSSGWVILRSGETDALLPAELKAVDPEAEDRVTGLRALTSPAAWQRLLEPWAGGAAARPEHALEVEDALEAAEPMTFEDLAPPPAPPILLGLGLSRALGVAPGDLVGVVRVDLKASSTRPLASRAFRVAGLVETGIHAYDEMWAITRLDVLAEPGEEPRAAGIELSVAEPLDAPLVADALARALGPGHSVTDWTTTFSQLFAAQKWETLIIGIALGLIGLVAGFNIFTILTLNVTARIADIGILGALGADPGRVTRIFLSMGLLLGGAGTAAGLLAGGLGAVLLDRHRLVALDPAVYLVTHVPFRVAAGDLAVVAAGMLVVSFLATVLPARAAARLDPVVALRSA